MISNKFHGGNNAQYSIVSMVRLSTPKIGVCFTVHRGKWRAEGQSGAQPYQHRTGRGVEDGEDGESLEIETRN